jgi:LysM repeat protein
LNRDYQFQPEIIKENNEFFHIVQKGDTLYSLSRKYDLTVEDLKKLNNMNDNALSIDQKIKIK